MGLKLFLKLFELFKHHTNILVGTNILHRAPPPPPSQVSCTCIIMGDACDPTRSYENTAYHNIRLIATAAFIVVLCVCFVFRRDERQLLPLQKQFHAGQCVQVLATESCRACRHVTFTAFNLLFGFKHRVKHFHGI